MRPFEPVNAEHAELATPRDERDECGIGTCGGELFQTGKPVYFKWLGELRILEQWACANCKTQGNILRRLDDGEIVRRSHLHTGSGFEFPQHEIVSEKQGVSDTRTLRPKGE